MRLTVSVLKSVSRLRRFQHIWSYKSVKKEYPFRPPPALQELGIPVIDPLQQKVDRNTKDREKWKPPVDNDLRFWKPPALEDRADYKQKEAFTYNPNVRLIEGLNQACELTKTQVFEGLPSSVQNLVGKIQVPNEDTLLQQIIMNSQVWDGTKLKLPKRIDKSYVMWKFQRQYGIPKGKSTRMILGELVRLCQTVAHQIPSTLLTRQLISDPYLGAHFYYNDELINIQGSQDFLLASTQYLPPFCDEATIQASVQHTLPSIFPIFPTINCIRENNYTVQDFAAINTHTGRTKPHTIFISNKDFWPNDVRQSRALMFALGYAVTHAKSLYGDVKDLPQPVCVQCVNMDETTINFLYFQLNTMDFGRKDGVKNLAWLDTNNQLFRKVLSKPWLGPEFSQNTYDSYNPQPFHKLLASVLHGLPGLENV